MAFAKLDQLQKFLQILLIPYLNALRENLDSCVKQSCCEQLYDAQFFLFTDLLDFQFYQVKVDSISTFQFVKIWINFRDKLRCSDGKVDQVSSFPEAKVYRILFSRKQAQTHAFIVFLFPTLQCFSEHESPSADKKTVYLFELYFEQLTTRVVNSF